MHPSEEIVERIGFILFGAQKKRDSQKLPGLCDSENVTLSDGRHWARNGQELNENRRSCHICFSQLSWNHCKSGKRSAALRDWCIRFFNALTYALALRALIWNGMIKISQQLGRPQVEPQLLKHGMAFDGNVACSQGNTQSWWIVRVQRKNKMYLYSKQGWRQIVNPREITSVTNICKNHGQHQTESTELLGHPRVRGYTSNLCILPSKRSCTA